MMAKSKVQEAEAILMGLLNDDIIQVRPSDRERFMEDWRMAMGCLEDATLSETVQVGTVHLTEGQNILQAQIHALSRDYISKRQQGYFMEGIRSMLTLYTVPVLKKGDTDADT